MPTLRKSAPLPRTSVEQVEQYTALMQAYASAEALWRELKGLDYDPGLPEVVMGTFEIVLALGKVADQIAKRIITTMEIAAGAARADLPKKKKGALDARAGRG